MAGLTGPPAAIGIEARSRPILPALGKQAPGFGARPGLLVGTWPKAGADLASTSGSVPEAGRSVAALEW